MLGKDTSFGEVGVINKGYRTASVISDEGGCLLRVSKQDWWRIMDGDTREMLAKQGRNYPSSSLLLRMLEEGQKWENYTKDIRNGKPITNFFPDDDGVIRS